MGEYTVSGNSLFRTAAGMPGCTCKLFYEYVSRYTTNKGRVTHSDDVVQRRWGEIEARDGDLHHALIGRQEVLEEKLRRCVEAKHTTDAVVIA